MDFSPTPATCSTCYQSSAHTHMMWNSIRRQIWKRSKRKAIVERSCLSSGGGRKLQSGLRDILNSNISVYRCIAFSTRTILEQTYDSRRAMHSMNSSELVSYMALNSSIELPGLQSLTRQKSAFLKKLFTG